MEVSFHGSIRNYTLGVKTLEVNGADTVRTLVEKLIEHFDEKFEKKILSEEECLFLVNGSGIMSSGGLDTPLTDECKVEILPHVSGG